MIRQHGLRRRHDKLEHSCFGRRRLLDQPCVLRSLNSFAADFSLSSRSLPSGTGAGATTAGRGAASVSSSSTAGEAPGGGRGAAAARGRGGNCASKSSSLSSSELLAYEPSSEDARGARAGEPSASSASESAACAGYLEFGAGLRRGRGAGELAMTVLYGIVGCYSCVSLRAARAVLTLARMRRCGASMRLRAAFCLLAKAERALLSGLVEGCPEAVLAVQ